MQLDTRQKFNAMMEDMASIYGTSAHWNGSDKFSVDPIAPEVEQSLEARIQEQSDLLGKINVIGVRDLKGEKLGLLSGRRVASRTNTDVKDRQTKYIGDMDGRKYELYKTDYDTHLPYKQVDNLSRYPEFQTIYRNKVLEQVATDRVTIGWYGETAADDTDPVAHPMLEDVNKGWLQSLREEKPENYFGADGTDITIGEGGTFPSLDEAIFEIVQTCLDPWHRNAGDLVVILGRELWKKYHLRMMSENLKALDRVAREEWLKNNTIGGISVRQEAFFPEKGLIVTSYNNLSLYYQMGARRRTIVDNAKRDRVEDYMSGNEGYVVEDFGKIGGIDHKHLTLV